MCVPAGLLGGEREGLSSSRTRGGEPLGRAAWRGDCSRARWVSLSRPVPVRSVTCLTSWQAAKSPEPKLWCRSQGESVCPYVYIPGERGGLRWMVGVRAWQWGVQMLERIQFPPPSSGFDVECFELCLLASEGRSLWHQFLLFTQNQS